MLIRFADVTQLYDHPEGREGRPRFAHVLVVSAIETYTVDAVPRLMSGYRAWEILIEPSILARSWMRLESLACLRSSAGLRTTTTAAVRMARMPMTINNSTSVNEEF